MTPHAKEVVGRFGALSRVLATQGFPETSPWWLGTVRDFYATGKRQLVVRKGRRAGGSSTLCRLAVIEGVYGKHAVPPGDVGVVSFISTTRDEASQRIRTIRAILDVLGVAYRPCDGGVELTSRNVVFKVFTASITGVSGFTCISAICDEVAKWRDVDTGANPASEVLASLRPTMATQREARIILSSSPMGMLDAHFDACELGSTDFQYVVRCATWEANPTLTEADTRALEPDEAVWRREYAAIPLAEHESSLLTESEVDAATRSEPLELGPETGVSYEAAMDPATRGDAWTLAIAALRNTPAGLRRSIVAVREWRGSRTAPLSPRAVLAEVAGILRPYRVDFVYSDQASGDALRDHAEAFGLTLIVTPTTATNRLAMYENLRVRIAAGEVELPPHPTVKADLLAVRKRITRAGVSIELPHAGGRHCDFAPAIALVVSKTTSEPVITHAVAFGSTEWNERQREGRRQALLARQEKASRQPWLRSRPPLAGWSRR